jgi:polyvinyl alcohol dehydrogenase (cytochrome)
MMKRSTILLAVKHLLLLGASMALSQLGSPTAFAQQGGAALYSKNCAQCHEQSAAETRVPSRSTMAAMPAVDILRALESGPMASVAKDISQADRTAIAEFISSKHSAQDSGTLPKDAVCQNTPEMPEPAGMQWNGWGNSITNSHLQSAAAAGIAPETVGRLKLKWAFGFRGAVNASAQPTVVGGRVSLAFGGRSL